MGSSASGRSMNRNGGLASGYTSYDGERHEDVERHATQKLVRRGPAFQPDPVEADDEEHA